MNWETYLTIDITIFRTLVEVVLEHAVDEMMVVVDHGKLQSSIISESRFPRHINESEESFCAHSISSVSACCVTAIFSKRAMFKFHDAFFIWTTTTINHSHEQLVGMRNDRFQNFYAS